MEYQIRLQSSNNQPETIFPTTSQIRSACYIRAIKVINPRLQQIMKLVITLALLVNFISCTKESVSVFRSYRPQGSAEPEETKVAEILLIKDEKKLTAELSLSANNIIQSSALKTPNDYAILTFRKGSQSFRYTISPHDVLQSNYKETINVIVNQNGDVIGYNYFQEKLKKKEYASSEIQVVRPEQGKEHVFAYTSAPTKPKGAQGEQQQQTFFSKYKWYLIGFGVVVYLMSNMDPEKMNQMAQQQAQK